MKRIALALLAFTLSVASASAQVVTNPAVPPTSICSYLASPPTLTDGQASWLRCDNSGALITTASGGGGGGAVTIANGADVALGTTTDSPASTPTTGSAATTIALLKAIANSNVASIPAGTNVIGHVIIDTTSTTAVTQATAASLNATVVGTGTFATQATLAAETTKIIGTVNQGTSPWVTSGTSTVSGTITANQGTSPWITAGGGTAGSAATGVVTVQGIASMTKLLVTPDSVALPANQSVNVAQINGVAPLMGNGVTGTGSPRVTIASDNTAFTVNAAQATAASLNATVVGTGTLAVQSQPTPVTSGGLSVYNVQPAASDNHIVIKAGAGQVYKIEAFNNSATVNYVRLYNATTGFNGCNSATNLVWQAIIPASTSGAGLASSWESGMAFATGISICITSGYAQTDTTNATASALVVNVGYK